MDRLVEVEDLVVRFPSRTGRAFHAVDGISFSVSRGERIGIVGESGSGKSVTAQAPMRLVPSPGAVGGGRILFEGRDVMDMTTGELQGWRGAQAAMVFQDPMSSLNPLLRIGTQIVESLRQHLGMGKTEATRRAGELLDRVGIPDASARLREYPGAFSGGMRQRVCIAIATACSPKLLIADEPTTALDVTVQAQVLDLLDTMADEQGAAVVLISHDLGVISNFCDRIVVMYAGRVVEAGPTSEIIEDPQHPYTRALLASIPRLRDAVPPGCPRSPGRRSRPERAPPVAPSRPGARSSRRPAGRSPPARCARWDRAERGLRRGRPQSLRRPCQHPTPGGHPVSVEAPAVAAAVEVSRLAVHFTRKGGVGGRGLTVPAVQDVSFSLFPGKTLGLAGESGSGRAPWRGRSCASTSPRAVPSAWAGQSSARCAVRR